MKIFALIGLFSFLSFGDDNRGYKVKIGDPLPEIQLNLLDGTVQQPKLRRESSCFSIYCFLVRSMSKRNASSRKRRMAKV